MSKQIRPVTALRGILDRMEALESRLSEPYSDADIRRARAIVRQMKRLALRARVER